MSAAFRSMSPVTQATEVKKRRNGPLAPRHRYFKLRGDDGGVYLVRHDVAEDIRELTLFDSGRLPTARLSST